MGLFSRSAPATHFPDAVGQRLSTGDEVRFPDDLPADATLLVVAFRDDLDPLSDQWARLGDRLIDAHGDRMGVWELPVVNKKLKVFGKLATVASAARSTATTSASGPVPLYVDTKAFRKELGLKTQGRRLRLPGRPRRPESRGAARATSTWREVEVAGARRPGDPGGPSPRPPPRGGVELEADGDAESGGEAAALTPQDGAFDDAPPRP